MTDEPNISQYLRPDDWAKAYKKWSEDQKIRNRKAAAFDELEKILQRKLWDSKSVLWDSFETPYAETLLEAVEDAMESE